MSSESHSMLTPVVIALMGLIPLGLMAMAASTPGPLEAVAPPPVITTVAVSPSTTVPGGEIWDRPVARETVITTPPPVIDGVTESVARVLANAGFAGEETLTELPASVIRVLRDRNVVLTVAVPGEGA